MSDTSTLIAIVGAGPSGLAVAKALKGRNIPYRQFEAEEDLGGNWYHGVYQNAHIISSKTTTEFADFPMPDSYPDFPNGQQMLAYLRTYAETFNLRENIEFKRKITAVKQRADLLWDVQLDEGEWTAFKGVVVCNGHHWDRRYPEYPGTFSGEILHSKDYKNPDQLRGKNVLVIGGGNSACDIASEAARVAKTCSLSLRHGYWFLPKTVFGTPLTEIFSVSWPVWAQRLILQIILKITVGDYQKYGLPHPNHKIFERHPTVNSELLHYLKHGRIKPYSDVRRYDGTEVEFVDGQKANFDLIVCATGYHLSIPFLPKELVNIKNGVLQVYGGSAMAEAKNLYVFGTLQPRYGFGPLMTPAANLLATMIEMQEKMVLPVGLVLKKMGDKPAKSPLVDPIQTLRQLASFKRRAFLVPIVEKQLRKHLAAGLNQLSFTENKR
jgi:cation diffusion facilitator CzcD-associated flavoprotein CzcO